MTNLRFVLLATTALTAMQFASSASQAQNAPPLVVAQAQPQETGPDGKPKQPPKGPAAAPPASPGRPAGPPPAAAPPHPPAAPPPAAAPPRPAAPPPPPAARPAPPPPAAPKQPSPPPPAAAPQQHAPTPPPPAPPAARPAPTPPAPPAAAPQQHAPTPTPPAARPSPTPPPPPAAGPAARRTSRHASGCRNTVAGARCCARTNGDASPWCCNAAVRTSRCGTDACSWRNPGPHGNAGPRRGCDTGTRTAGRNTSCGCPRCRNSACVTAGWRSGPAHPSRRCGGADRRPWHAGRSATAQQGAICSADRCAGLPRRADDCSSTAAAAASGTARPDATRDRCWRGGRRRGRRDHR